MPDPSFLDMKFCNICGKQHYSDSLQDGACEDCRNKAWDIAAAHGIEGIERMMV